MSHQQYSIMSASEITELTVLNLRPLASLLQQAYRQLHQALFSRTTIILESLRSPVAYSCIELPLRILDCSMVFFLVFFY